ncbi:ribosomal RNA small subunit methyltransferase, mitochondrial-like [Macadamia integrifolia]|uniref:ribosomal RNA small subunit methyltransferase, mitochondrial-like n=1 Tax=Macadamia integrifolia TaxID=60698 RepID=UPI001C4FDF82|nr:ribosomal RNA small subunit methyltransferase, mitochondrial-like [Macadamia integrifolia]
MIPAYVWLTVCKNIFQETGLSNTLNLWTISELVHIFVKILPRLFSHCAPSRRADSKVIGTPFSNSAGTDSITGSGFYNPTLKSKQRRKKKLNRHLSSWSKRGLFSAREQNKQMLRRAKCISIWFNFNLRQLRLIGKPSTRHYLRKREDDDYCVNKRRRNAKDGNEAHHHLHLHKSRGQHILTNSRVLDSIVRQADIRPSDTILEIGPGTGNLTLKLLEAAHKVVAVEIDKRMIDIVCNRVSQFGFQDRFTVIYKDALKTDFPQFDLIIANIPYGISSPLIAKFVFGGHSFRSATLLLQKEFARRLLAKPGDSAFNRLAVNVKLVADVEFVMDVSKRDFVPCPKVDSSVVKIRPKATVPEVDMDEWWAFTRTCFSKKNKTLGATLKQKKKVIELLKRSQLSDSMAIAQRDNAVATKYNYDAIEEEEDEEDDEEGEEEKGEGCSSSYFAETEMGLFREKIVGVLKAGGFEGKRPSKLSHEELLGLLSLFNQAGIHFNN